MLILQYFEVEYQPSIGENIYTQLKKGAARLSTACLLRRLLRPGEFLREGLEACGVLFRVGVVGGGRRGGEDALAERVGDGRLEVARVEARRGDVGNEAVEVARAVAGVAAVLGRAGDGERGDEAALDERGACLLYTSPSPRDATLSRMPSSA